MNIYKLTLKDESPCNRPVWDVTNCVVVLAPNEEAARFLASQNAGDEAKELEGVNPWLYEQHSNCREISLEGTSEVLCVDFNAG